MSTFFCHTVQTSFFDFTFSGGLRSSCLGGMVAGMAIRTGRADGTGKMTGGSPGIRGLVFSSVACARPWAKFLPQRSWLYPTGRWHRIGQRSWLYPTYDRYKRPTNSAGKPSRWTGWSIRICCAAILWRMIGPPTATHKSKRRLWRWAVISPQHLWAKWTEPIWREAGNDCYRRAAVSLTDPNTAEAHDDILIQNARALYSEGRSWTCKRERQTRFDKGISKHSVSEKEGLGHQIRALLDVPQKLSGTERVKKVYKGQSQLHVGKEAQCDGHLLEHETVNPRKVTQRPKKMSKDDAMLPLKRRGMLPGELSLNEKAGFSSSKKSMGKMCGLRARTGIRSRNWWLGWGADSVSSDLEESTVYLVSNRDPPPRAFLARSSQRRCGHERKLARSWVCCVFHWFLHACCRQEKDFFFPRAVCQEKPGVPILTESLQQRNKFMGKFWFDISTHGVMSRSKEESFPKKRASCQHWQRVFGHVKVQPPLDTDVKRFV